MMIRKQSIALFFTLMVALSLHAAERPNIIIIMADDMGYSDAGCYGSEIETPTLDALAKTGLRFTQFYNTSRCCPTRASLLTGLYPHQAGIGHMTDPRNTRGYRGTLLKSCVTIAQVLKTAGYRNYHVGKWHVFTERNTTNAKNPEMNNWPRQRGFDRNYSMLSGAGSFFDPKSLARDNTRISPFADPGYKPEGTYYFTDAISDNAVRYIQDHKKEHTDKPFFMYVAYTAPHWPMHALPEDIAKYKGRYDAGYEAIRKARYEKAKKEGVIGDESPFTKGVGRWKGVKDKNRDWELRCMEVFAAMIDRMDQGIGKIVTSLKKEEMFDNTLILYLQDNGGCAEGLGRWGRGKFKTRPEKAPFPPMKSTDLQMGMIPRKTRDGFPLVMGPGIMPGPADTYIAYGEKWANVSNTPFRKYKHYVHEGGIATPLIVSYPKGLKGKGGSTTSSPSHLIDLMATCVDYAGATYPKEVKGTAITPLEGISLRPEIEDKKLERGKPIFFEHEGNGAIRDGKWKLVALKNGVKKNKWELYDMTVDRSETNNLATKHPEIVKELRKKWYDWAKACYVYPSPFLGKGPKE